MDSYISNIIDESTKEYGLHIGEVVSKVKDDKKKRNRYKVRIIGIDLSSTPDDKCVYAEISALPIAGKKPKSSGLSSYIEKGTFVYLMFLNGEITNPVILGIVHGNEDVSDEFDEDQIVFETHSGHLLHFNDKKGEESILIKHGKKATKIEFDKDGNVKLDVEKDVKVQIKGNADIKVDGNTSLKTVKLKITSSQTHKGDVEIDGALKVTGSVKANGAISTDSTVSDMMGNLTTHTHLGKSGSSPLARV